jgi:integrase
MVAQWLHGSESSMAKVTKRSIDALKPVPGLHTFLWDDELRGFGVRCMPSGLKVYVLKYRTQGGRQRWLTLGQHGALTPEQARTKAGREKAAVSNGADPSDTRQSKRREETVGVVADRYLAEHVAAHNKPSTAAEVGRIVEKRIKPGLGRAKITELSRADIKAWHQKMSATPYEANRSLAYLSKMLSLAVKEWELRGDNPAIGVKRFPERARERFFSDGELTKIGGALAVAEREGGEPPGFILLIRLLATTGMRLGEMLALHWADVDLPGRAIRLPDAKAGARTVHLGASAVAFLDAIPEAERIGHVVTGADAQKPLPFSTAQHAWARLREHAGVPDGRLHDLRHTAGTFAALGGANAFAVRDLLGHRTLAMTGRYVERAADMVRATADAVSSRVAAALNAGQTPPAEVINLAGRK